MTRRRARPQYNFPTDLYPYFSHLTQLIRYVCAGNHTQIAQGRYATHNTGVIYWPHIAANPTYLERMRRILPSPAPELQPRHKKRSWWITYLKNTTEDLLDRLLLQPEWEDTWRQYADIQTAELDEAACSNPLNYTTFRRVGAGEQALQRVLIDPPPEPEVKSQYLPDHVLALYAGWKALANYRSDPFNRAQVGLDYTKNGYLFLNWTRFARSRFWPSRIVQCPEDIPRQLAAMRSPTLKHGYIPVDYTVYQPTPLEKAQGMKYNKFLRLCFFLTDAFVLDTENSIDSVSIIDSSFLAMRPQLFNGWAYRQRVQRVQHSMATRKARALNQKDINAQRAQLTSFVFKPLEHVREIEEEFGVWFPTAHKETIYAIRRQDQLLFTRPRLLSQARNQAPSEVEAWCRALDSLRIVENFRDGNDVGNLKEASRSAYYANMHQAQLTEAAASVITHFVSLDKLNPTDMAKVRHKLAKTFQEDHPGMDSSRWYNEMKMQEAKQFIKLTAVRRVARVVLPSNPDGEPTNETFYTPLALKLFSEICEATYGAQTAAMGENQTLSTLASMNYGRAPYLLAWTRFCESMQTHGASFALPRSMVPWTPLEDIVLMQAWSPGQFGEPKMTPNHWRELLKALPNRTQLSCSIRARKVRESVQQVTTTAQMGRSFRPRHLLANELDAKKMVLIFGYALTLPENQKMPRTTTVGSILRLPKYKLNSINFPLTYHGGFFQDLERWVPPAVRARLR